MVRIFEMSAWTSSVPIPVRVSTIGLSNASSFKEEYSTSFLQLVVEAPAFTTFLQYFRWMQPTVQAGMTALTSPMFLIRGLPTLRQMHLAQRTGMREACGPGLGLLLELLLELLRLLVCNYHNLQMYKQRCCPFLNCFSNVRHFACRQFSLICILHFKNNIMH